MSDTENDSMVLYNAKKDLANRFSELEAQMLKDKASAAALDAAKEALVTRVSELEAQMSKDKASTATLDTAKAALAVRVSELEAQAIKDKAGTSALDAAKAALATRVSELEAQVIKDKASTGALADRVSELEEQILINEDDAAVMYDAKKELTIRVSELEVQMSKDKANTAKLDAARAALAVHASELEQKITLTLKEKNEVDALVRELRDAMALHAADLIKSNEAYAARELSFEKLVKSKDAELGGLQERLDRLVLAQDSRDKENQNNLMIIKEHREKKGFLEATTSELKHQVGELEAQRDRLRVKAAHARFGARQSEGINGRPNESSFQRGSGASSHGAFDLLSSEADNFNMGNMCDFSDSDGSMLPDISTDPDTTTTAIDSSFDADSDMDRSRISEVAKKVTSTGSGAVKTYLDLDPNRK